MLCAAVGEDALAEVCCLGEPSQATRSPCQLYFSQTPLYYLPVHSPFFCPSPLLSVLFPLPLPPLPSFLSSIALPLRSLHWSVALPLPSLHSSIALPLPSLHSSVALPLRSLLWSIGLLLYSLLLSVLFFRPSLLPPPLCSQPVPKHIFEGSPDSQEYLQLYWRVSSLLCFHLEEHLAIKNNAKNRSLFSISSTHSPSPLTITPSLGTHTHPVPSSSSPGVAAWRSGDVFVSPSLANTFAASPLGGSPPASHHAPHTWPADVAAMHSKPLHGFVVDRQEAGHNHEDVVGGDSHEGVKGGDSCEGVEDECSHEDGRGVEGEGSHGDVEGVDRHHGGIGGAVASLPCGT